MGGNWSLSIRSTKIRSSCCLEGVQKLLATKLQVKLTENHRDRVPFPIHGNLTGLSRLIEAHGIYHG